MTGSLPQDLVRRLALVGAVRPLLLCTDYDGTLAPIAPRPEQARLLPGASDVLNRLARLPDTCVAIISGRPRDNLRLHSGLEEPILLVGSHGAELPGHALQESAQDLDALEHLLAPICASAPGTWLERKPVGIAVHFRQASAADASRVPAEIRTALEHRPSLHVMEGKAVLELSLSRQNKGDAVSGLRTRWQSADTVVIYLGDDVTDEAAFAALRAGDVGIKVGGGSSRAEYRVGSEHDVLNVLALLWQLRSGGDGQ